MTYTVWIYNSSTDEWHQSSPHEYAGEWEAYFHATMLSILNGYTTLRDPTGTNVYAVFSWGMRIWHTIETNHG